MILKHFSLKKILVIFLISLGLTIITNNISIYTGNPQKCYYDNGISGVCPPPMTFYGFPLNTRTKDIFGGRTTFPTYPIPYINEELFSMILGDDYLAIFLNFIFYLITCSGLSIFIKVVYRKISKK
ncbi:hypothetical protein HY029_04425 [Candidatus Gottesmanbacteria bacterium]|nr:hypothetical protein [Candidatus Gottesmanbacteria bacterium]